MPMNVNMDYDFTIQDDGFDNFDDNASELEFPLENPIANTNTPALDSEQCNFVMLDEEPTENVILNPDTAVFTNDRRVKVILLKILMELEAELWAFNEIMEWALDMQQSDYKLLPEQNSYKNPIAISEKWVGMDHMHPNVVSVKLPGQRDDNYIDFTTFNFIHQFHSLLLDPVLNIPDNLVLNATDSFAQYVAPDGRLGKCLSGSWYRHAWTLMEENQLGDFMIPFFYTLTKHACHLPDG
jgi:hypothetical protein